jgi:hypothetical protein
MNQTRRIESIIFDQQALFPNIDIVGTGLKVAIISNAPYCYFVGEEFENGIYSFHLGNIVVPKSFVFAGHFDNNATDNATAAIKRTTKGGENLLMPILLDLKKTEKVQSNFSLSSSPAHDAFHASDDRLKATEGCGGLPSNRTTGGGDDRDASFKFPYYTALKSIDGGRPQTFFYIPVVLPNLTIAYFEKAVMGDEVQTIATTQIEMNTQLNELSFPLIVGNDIILDENLGGALLVKKLELPEQM